MFNASCFFLIIERPFVYYDQSVATTSKAKIGIRVLDEKEYVITKLPVFLEGTVLFRGPSSTDNATTATLTTIRLAVNPPSVVYVAVTVGKTTSQRLKDEPWNLGRWQEVVELNEIDLEIKMRGIGVGIKLYRKTLYRRSEEAITTEGILAVFVDEGSFCSNYR